MKRLTLGLTCASSLLLGACSAIPDHQLPFAPVPADWPTGAAYLDGAAAGAGAVIDLSWRGFFRDEALQRVIAVALEHNRDLRIAALNVEAFRAQYRIRHADLLPGVGVDGSFSRQQQWVPFLGTDGGAVTTSHYGLSVGLSSWEVDFFGRLRSLERGALETYLATEEARRAAQVALVGDVALAYLGWRTDQALLELALNTRDSYADSLRLLELSAAEGIASGLAVRQARSLLHQAQADVAEYTRREAEDRNALQLLLGAPLPEGAEAGLALETEVLAALPVGLPAELLTRRPDIRAAERRLLAANADIGAARAAFFPSIRLTAAGGVASAELDSLLDGGAEVWSFVPQIHLPIFTGGRLRANLDLAEVRRDVRVAEYEKSIQTAFREVADALAARGTWQAQLQAQRDLVETTTEYTTLAEQRYDAGIDSFLTVLDARRGLLAARQQLLLGRLAQLGAEVRLYKALGGGWE